MFIEAVLYVCLSTPINDWKGDRTTGPTCVHMNTGQRTFPIYNLGELATGMEQCMMWNSQGIKEVQTREHFDAIRQKLKYSPDADATLHAKCVLHQYEEPFQCGDCEL